MSALNFAENETFIKSLLLLGFTVGTATKVLDNLASNRAIIRLVISGNNFTFSDRQAKIFSDAVTRAGISIELSKQVTGSVQQVQVKVPKETIKMKSTSAFTRALITGGLTTTFAKTLVNALNSDDKVIELASEKKNPIVYMTQRDNKVDDIICLPLEGNVYARDDPKRPRIPSGTHLNCRCYWIDAITGENLGQF